MRYNHFDIISPWQRCRERALNVYRVKTDQKEFYIKAAWIDYKETIKDYYKQGYTNISISCIGRSI
jgi:hypothetical protein